MAAERHNIVLTGFMGTGKSAVGRQAAEVSGREFVDLDAAIVAKHGDIAAIFDEAGEDAFRQIERSVVAEVAPRRNLVIATGGGTLLDDDNVIAFLGADIFTLTAETEELISRLTADGLESRPLLADVEDPKARVTELLEERSEAYARFTQVDTTGKSIDQIVRELKLAGADLEPPAQQLGSAEQRERVLWAVAAVGLAIVVILFVMLMTF